MLAEPFRSPDASAFGFDVAIARLGTGHQRIQQTSSNRSHLVDGTIERCLVGSRRVIEARELSHELQRSSPDLLVGSRGVEIEQCLDAPAHSFLLALMLLGSHYSIQKTAKAEESLQASLCHPCTS